MTHYFFSLDCSRPLLASNEVPNVEYSSSDADSHPEYALFNSGKAWCTGKSPLNEQYLQVSKIFVISSRKTMVIINNSSKYV